MKRASALLTLLFGIVLAIPATAQGAPQNNQLTSLLIKVKSGITLNYVVQGDPKGPVIVLLHGAGDSWHSFDRVFPLIPSTYRVYAITMRGHGLSDHPETGFSRQDFAGDILDFMDQLNLKHVTLAGHSLGSSVAQTVAEEDTGHRLDRLVLIASGPPRKRVANPDSATNSFATMKDPVPYTLARDFQTETIYGPVPAWFYEKLVDEAELVPAATWRGLGSAQNNESVDDLKKIRVPTLVVWGDHDVYNRKADEDVLVKTIPNCTFKVYANTGHALHWEQPERFTRDMLAFIAEHPSGK